MGIPEQHEIRKIYCNNCKLETNHERKAFHDLIYSEVFYEEPENSSLSVGLGHQICCSLWICRGCDACTFEEAYSNDIMQDPESWFKEPWNSTFYPKRENTILPVKQFRRLSENLATIYQEVIVATNAGLKAIPAIGLRTLLEGICVDKGITDEDKETRGLEGKLKKLKEDKHLPANIVEGLHSFKFMGDGAAHRFETFNKDELLLAIEVMEDLLNFIYEVEYNLASKTKLFHDRYSSQIEELSNRKQQAKRIAKAKNNLNKEQNK